MNADDADIRENHGTNRLNPKPARGDFTLLCLLALVVGFFVSA
jgi:hypothetical protein